jgi:hypothetical protein
LGISVIKPYSDHISFRIGANVIRKVVTAGPSPFFATDLDLAKVTLDYIEMPVVARLDIGSTLSASFGLGVTPALLMGSSVVSGGSFAGTNGGEDSSARMTPSRFDLGVVLEAELGVELDKGLRAFLGVSHSQSIGNVFERSGVDLLGRNVNYYYRSTDVRVYCGAEFPLP